MKGYACAVSMTICGSCIHDLHSFAEQIIISHYRAEEARRRSSVVTSWSSLPFTWSHATLRPPALALGPYAKFGGASGSSPEVVPVVDD